MFVGYPVFWVICIVIIVSGLYIRTKYKYNYFPVIKWIRIFYFDFLTSTGRLFLWLAFMSGFLGLTTTAMKTYMVFTLISALFAVSFIFARSFRPKLSAKRFLPHRTTCGQKLVTHISIRNNTPGYYYDVVFKEGELPKEIKSLKNECPYISSIAPEDEYSFTMELEFLKRGSYEISPLRGETIFPFGICSCGINLTEKHHFLVYPRFNSLDTFNVPAGSRYQPGGIALTSSVGESTEFIGNREYRDGDNPRNIDWRSWARTGKPVVKEFQEEYFCRIALLLDTFVSPGSPPVAYESFESAISISASVADYLSREEYVIDIFAAGPNIYYMQAGRSLSYLENILDLLACIDVCPHSPFEKIEPVLMEHLSNISTVITVFLDWDDRREKLVRMIKDMGTDVKVIIVKDGNTTTDPLPYEGLVGPMSIITTEEEKKGVSEL